MNLIDRYGAAFTEIRFLYANYTRIPSIWTDAMSKILYPDRRIGRVTELSGERLAAWGIESLLLDADCTLKRYRSSELEPDITEWLTTMKGCGIGLRLVSNGLGDRIGALADRLGIPYTPKALKPLPFGVRRALRASGFDPKKTAMVGDQLLADILAGNLAGVATILVDPIHPEEEHWYTRLKRPPERLLLRWLKKSGG